jgi:hypothetical protein
MGNLLNKNDHDKELLDKNYFKQIMNVKENLNYGNDLSIYKIELNINQVKNSYNININNLHKYQNIYH